VRSVHLVVLLALAACTPRAPAPSRNPTGPAAPGVTVTLRWAAPVDLDLYVTDPGLETLYFANPRTASGGALERDVRCAGQQPGEQAERARWTKPPPGRYRVGVDFPETCRGRASEVPYALTVEVDGRRQEIAARARRGERQPLVLEFTVAGPPAGEVR
jgi:hypothetical protein